MERAMTVRIIDPRDKLRENISRLEALLDTEQGLSAEARVTALTSVVQAQSSLLAAEAADALEAAVVSAQDDVVTPLSIALNAFGRSPVSS
jgi:hypothetical protein